jgi:hypothetical protein
MSATEIAPSPLLGGSADRSTYILMSNSVVIESHVVEHAMHARN